MRPSTCRSVRSKRRFSVWPLYISYRFFIMLLAITVLHVTIFLVMMWQSGFSAESYHLTGFTKEPAAILYIKAWGLGEESSPHRFPLAQKLENFPRIAPQLSLFPAGFLRIGWMEARKEYDQLLQQPVGAVVQSVKNYKDIRTYKQHGILLPTLLPESSNDHFWEPGAIPHSSKALQDYYAQEELLLEWDTETYNTLHQSVGSVEFCNPVDANYTPSKDFACIAYLSNPANWLALKPMSSLLSSGRTVKLLLSFRHNNVTAVVKMSESRFRLEPASEVVAFHMDRVLGFRRVPPTAWVLFPVEYIKAASATLGAYYVHWMEESVLSGRRSKKIIENCTNRRLATALQISDPQCIWVSVQLWMWDVDPVETSSFRDVMSHLPGITSPCKGDDFDTMAGENDDDNATRNISICVLQRKSLTTAMELFVMHEHWDQLAFDTIIGNVDRWFGHNSFTIAACEPQLPCHTARAKRLYERPSKTGPRLAYIDQGSAFYMKGISSRSVFAGNDSSFCYVNNKTVERLQRIVTFACIINERIKKHDMGNEAPTVHVATCSITGLEALKKEEMKVVGDATYHQLLLPRLPAKIGHVIPHSRIKYACHRLWLILSHRTRCLQKNGRSVLF